MVDECIVAENHKKLLRFFWAGELFEDQDLLNGIPLCPRLFTKLLTTIYGRMGVFPYIDDSFILGMSKADCKIAVFELTNLSVKLGF